MERGRVAGEESGRLHGEIYRAEEAGTSIARQEADRRERTSQAPTRVARRHSSRGRTFDPPKPKHRGSESVRVDLRLEILVLSRRAPIRLSDV